MEEVKMSERFIAEAFHPGEYLRDELDERGWTQAEFAEIINRPYQLVNEIVMGKRGVTPETAKAFGAALGTSAELWMNLETTYQLWRTDAVSPVIAQKAKIRNLYPVRDMTRRLWIQPSEDIQVIEARLLRFFEIASLEEKPKLSFSAKKTGEPEEISPIQYAWVYRVKHIAEKMQVSQYSKTALNNAVYQLSSFLSTPEDIKHVPELLANCGVRLLVVEPLPSSKIDGVCFWLNETSPVIGLTLRLDRIDNFWYVLRHEIEHILNEDGKDIAILDSELHNLIDNQKGDILESEKIAHTAAANFCSSQEKLDDFMERVGPHYSRRHVLSFALKEHIHPGIVVGQLQRRLNRYDLFRQFLIPVRYILTSVAITDGYEHVLPIDI
jgi:HTH-type transcriptional regulator/antitoxin HigA